MKVEVQRITPFSNGSEAMSWMDANCDCCVKSYKPGNGEMPDFCVTKNLVNLGMECKMKFHMDLGMLDGTVSVDIAAQIGYTEEKGWPNSCIMWSDDEKDGWKPSPRKPKDAPDCQMCLPLYLPLQIEQLQTN